MQAVKIKLYQNMVNYRREMSYGYVQTYPLPTPSMVRGMVHSLIDADKYFPLQISVQGNYSSVVTDMQKVYKFDRKGRYPIPVAVNSSEYNQSINQGLMFVDEIVDMNLVIHITFKDKSLNKKLLSAVQNKTVVLGRNEDIARMDDCRIVEVVQSDERQQKLPMDIYVPGDFDKSFGGTSYRLPFKYESVNSFLDKRIFKFVDARYITKGRELRRNKFPVDDENYPIAFLNVDDE